MWKRRGWGSARTPTRASMQQTALQPVRRADQSTTDVTQTVTEPQAAADRRVDPSSQMCGVQPSETGTPFPARLQQAADTHLSLAESIGKNSSSSCLSFERPLFPFPLFLFINLPYSVTMEKRGEERTNVIGMQPLLSFPNDSLPLSLSLSSP